MDTLLRGLHYSRYAILREVVENEFADEVPEEKREAFILKLLPLVGNVFSVYDLSDDNFALSSDYDLLYTELTGATVLYYRGIWRLTANRNCGTTSRRYGRHSSLTGNRGQRQPKNVPYFKGTAVSAGLKCILNPAKELTDAVQWAKSDLELFAPTVELHRLVRENSKDETEYKRYVDAMKAVRADRFLHPPEITGTIADVLHEHGIRPDRVLEPSAGVGRIRGCRAGEQPGRGHHGFRERPDDGQDIGAPASRPESKGLQGFEKIERPFTNYFDLAVVQHPVRRHGCVRPGVYRKPRPGKALRTRRPYTTTSF